MEAALGRAAQSRTTIVIAHRLATISDADKIIVMEKGKVVQQGTHDDLVKIQRGVYWNLVRSQQLTTSAKDSIHQMRDDVELELYPKRQSVIALKESYETLVESELTAAESIHSTTPFASSAFSPWKSLYLLIVEQKRNWWRYSIMVVAAMCAGGEYHIQSFSRRFD